MSTLYQLTTEYQNLLDYAASEDHEDAQAFRDTLESIDFEVGLKADQYATVIRHLEGQLAVIDNEISRLKTFRNVVDTNTRIIKERLRDAMIAMGKTEIKTNINTFKVVKNGGKLPLVNFKDVPAEYTIAVPQVDNEKIRKALDNGERLTFAYYGERGTHLSIR